MSWQERPYSDGNNFDQHGSRGGGLQSWFGGMPPLSKAVKRIILANIAMFILCQLTGGMASPIYQWMAMQTDKVLHGQIWRLLTFTYIHDQQGLGHLFFNMLGLYFLGVPLERTWGAKRFFVFYTLGGLAAVSLYLLISGVGWLSPYGILVGASGGVLAVLGTCAVLFPQFRIILVFFPVPIRTAALLFVVFYIFNLLNRSDNAGGDACHLAGMVFGVACGYRGHAWTQRWHQWRNQINRGAQEARRREVMNLETEVDRILDKVKHEGIHSLSRREKKQLAEATQQKQAADRR